MTRPPLPYEPSPPRPTPTTPADVAPDGSDLLDPPQHPFAPEPPELVGFAGLRSSGSAGLSPVPTVVLDTVSGIATALPSDGSVPPLVVLDPLRVEWGRAGVLQRQTPATATVTLFDTSSLLLLGKRADLIGLGAVLGWTLPGVEAGILLRGRITDVSRRPFAVARPDGSTLRGVLVELRCASREADAGNYITPPKIYWTNQTLSARRDILFNNYLSALFTGIGIDSTWAGGPCVSRLMQSVDGLTLLGQLYDSQATAYTYDPASNRITYVKAPRYDSTTDNHHARLLPDPAAGGLYGAFATSIAASALDPLGPPAFGLYLDAGALVGEVELSQDQAAKISRVHAQYAVADLTYPTTIQEPGEVITLVDGVSETSTGRRALNVDSWWAGSSWATSCASFWVLSCRMEGAEAQLSPFTYDTRATGGFQSTSHMRDLLQTAESSSLYFLRGSELPRLGHRPVFQVIGGAVEYRGGRWLITVTPASLATPRGSAKPGLKVRNFASSTAVRLRDLDPSLTFADTEFVSVGAGFTLANMPA